MTALAVAQGLLQRLADAAPVAWRHDPVFRGAAVGAAVTLALFLLRMAGPHAPELDQPADNFDAATRKALVMGLRREEGPSQPLPLDVPKIAPGHSLSDVMIAPAPNGDRFGTFTPGKHP